MAKLVIEVPEELRGLGEAFATMVARVQGPVAGTRGGTAVDYGQVEQTIAEEAGGIELAAHRTILEALDVDVPTVIIGGRTLDAGPDEVPSNGHILCQSPIDAVRAVFALHQRKLVDRVDEAINDRRLVLSRSHLAQEACQPPFRNGRDGIRIDRLGIGETRQPRDVDTGDLVVASRVDVTVSKAGVRPGGLVE